MIKVLSAGPLMTVQDLGRYGAMHWGIPAAGALDTVSLRIANLLAGNPDYVPAVEMTMQGGQFQFDAPATAAVFGAPADVMIDDQPARFGATLALRAGQVLRVGATKGGVRSYLAVAGGIDVPLLLGSGATHIASGIGGRALRSGDELKVAKASEKAVPRYVKDGWRYHIYNAPNVRVTPGMHADRFSARALFQLLSTEFFVRADSDRAGVRLGGATLPYPGEVVSEGMPLGALQITPSGEPIVLLADGPVTGGYPVLANLISADLHLMGQLRPRQKISFTPVSMEVAGNILAYQENLIGQLVVEGKPR
jgi:biotin-dependent carboxylase-like uncharacterized protein